MSWRASARAFLNRALSICWMKSGSPAAYTARASFTMASRLPSPGGRHRIDMKRSTSGKTVTIYGQTEVTRDLMDARDAAGLPTVFEAENVALSGFDTDKPSVTYVKDGASHSTSCDFIARCDGFQRV